MTATNKTVKVKTFSLSLATQYGPLPSLSVEIPDLSMRLSEPVPLMQAVCDTMISQAVAAMNTGDTLTCAKGCSACCRQVVPVSIPELLFVSAHIASMPPGRQEIVMSQLSSAHTNLRHDDLLGALLGAPSDEAAMCAAQEYLNRGITCPFLEDGVCSIHPVRPFACREFNVTTPSQWCDDPFHHKVQRIPITPKITTIMARFAAKMLQEQVLVLPLTMIGSEETDISSWCTLFKGIELFETLMECFTK